MTLGVDDYLRWTPVELERAAHWFEENSGLLDRVSTTVRDGVERGTEEQWGEFIESIRLDGADASARINQLADLMLGAGTSLRDAGAALVSSIEKLRGVIDEAEAEGFFVRNDGSVKDGSTGPLDAAEKLARTASAEGFRDRVSDLLTDIRATDDDTNRQLHALVDRDVRDRTHAGNSDPSSTYAAAAIDFNTGLVEMNVDKMIAAGELPMLDGKWWNSARGLGLFGNLVGFAGGVASAPEGEPWYETLVAEGAGVVGGTIGSAVGPVVASAFPRIKLTPSNRLLSSVGGGIFGSIAVSSRVREAFDRAN